MLRIIEKRDGRHVPYDRARIENAALAALRATSTGSRPEALRVAKKVEEKLLEELGRSPGRIPKVEEIQDVVEETLMEEGFFKAARAYVRYRDARTRARNARQGLLEISTLVEEYVNRDSWRVRENANVDYAFPGLVLHVVQGVISRYTLQQVLPPREAEAHRRGDVHVHDLGFGIVGYCAGWSLQELFLRGFGAPGHTFSKPPRRMGAAAVTAANFLGTLQNEWAGAQAFSSFDVLLAPFVREEGRRLERLAGVPEGAAWDERLRRELEKVVRQAVQQFVYNVNVSSRWGGQPPFTNVTLDLAPLGSMAREAAVINGRPAEYAYGDLRKETEMVAEAFLLELLQGDGNGTVFPFPIPTFSLTRDFDYDSRVAKLLFELAGKYGTPYFQNFVNDSSGLSPEDVRSMCCRLRLDKRELLKKGGGLFGAGEKTGSIGVVTINLPRLAYKARREDSPEKAFFRALDEQLEVARTALAVKRDLLEKNLAAGLLPWTREYLPSFDRHFSTVGIIGGDEACLNLLGKGIRSPEGREFAKKVLLHCRERISAWQAQEGILYNLEATPAEGAAHRLAKIDAAHLPGCALKGGPGKEYYTNSTCLPVGEDVTLAEALDHQAELQPLYTGGTVFHVFLGERMDGHAAAKLCRRIAEGWPIPYFSLTPTYSLCPAGHGTFSGERDRCPECGGPVEVFSRVTGYYRPVSRWNPGKQGEWKERRTYDV